MASDNISPMLAAQIDRTLEGGHAVCGPLTESEREALEKRMPRAAFRETADGSLFLPAVVVDYVAHRIFGDRLSVFLGEPTVLRQDREMIVVSVKARVVIGGETDGLVREAMGVSAIEIRASDRTLADCYKLAVKGAATDARRTAIQLLGPVFGGYELRDEACVIQDVRQAQAQHMRPAANESEPVVDAEEVETVEETKAPCPRVSAKQEAEMKKRIAVKAASQRIAPKAGKGYVFEPESFVLRSADGSEAAYADGMAFCDAYLAAIEAAEESDELEALIDANDSLYREKAQRFVAFHLRKAIDGAIETARDRVRHPAAALSVTQVIDEAWRPAERGGLLRGVDPLEAELFALEEEFGESEAPAQPAATVMAEEKDPDEAYFQSIQPEPVGAETFQGAMQRLEGLARSGSARADLRSAALIDAMQLARSRDDLDQVVEGHQPLFEGLGAFSSAVTSVAFARLRELSPDF